MKTSFLILTIILLSSCSAYRYQICEMQCENTSNSTDVVFDNEDVKICYDFSSENGNSGFSIFNKTNKSIYINLNNTHSIINMEANTFYQGKILTEQVVNKKNSINRLPNQSVFFEITTPQQEIVEIPSNSYKTFEGFDIRNHPYLREGFGSKKNGAISFKLDNTPVVLKNIVSYTIDDVAKILTNDLWIKSIKNVKFLPDQIDKNKFYIKYIPSNLNASRYKGGLVNHIRKNNSVKNQ